MWKITVAHRSTSRATRAVLLFPICRSSPRRVQRIRTGLPFARVNPGVQRSDASKQEQREGKRTRPAAMAREITIDLLVSKPQHCNV